MLADPGVVGGGLEGEVEGDLDPARAASATRAEVVESSRARGGRRVAALAARRWPRGCPTSPGAAVVGESRPLRAVRADGVDRRQVQDVEAHPLHVVQARRTSANVPCGPVRGRRAREQLVPGAEAGPGPLGQDGVDLRAGARRRIGQRAERGRGGRSGGPASVGRGPLREQPAAISGEDVALEAPGGPAATRPVRSSGRARSRARIAAASSRSAPVSRDGEVLARGRPRRQVVPPAGERVDPGPDGEAVQARLGDRHGAVPAVVEGLRHRPRPTSPIRGGSGARTTANRGRRRRRRPRREPFADGRLGRAPAPIDLGPDITHHGPHPGPRQRHRKRRMFFFFFGCSLACGTPSPGRALKGDSILGVTSCLARTRRRPRTNCRCAYPARTYRDDGRSDLAGEVVVALAGRRGAADDSVRDPFAQSSRCAAGWAEGGTGSGRGAPVRPGRDEARGAGAGVNDDDDDIEATPGVAHGARGETTERADVTGRPGGRRRARRDRDVGDSQPRRQRRFNASSLCRP